MRKTTKYIVITSINPPSEAILKFREWPDWQVVVAGDRKTPIGWACDGVIFLGIEEQYKLFGALAGVIPENTYARKMLGYVYAIQHGAAVILDSDDDNIAYDDAQKSVDKFVIDPSRALGERRSSASGWLNVYLLFGVRKCWPRGFPIEEIKNASINGKAGCDNRSWAIVQFLSDEDPDVDAIYRMVDGSPCYFARDRQFILDAGSYCPVNSQATLWTAETFPLLFLPIGVFDRVTDILRGYIVTAALWRMGFSVTYASPIVYQKRNVHNLHKDFLQEIPLYANAVSWCRQLKEIKANTAVGFYRMAIRMLERQNVFSMNNSAAYDLFLRTANLL